MYTSISLNGYSVKKCELSSTELNNIIVELTVSPNNSGFVDDSLNKSYKLYSESASKLYVPKAYGYKKFGLPKYYKLPSGDAIHDSIRFAGELRTEQNEPVNALLTACSDPMRCGGILNVFCGGGKTTMALYVLTQLKVKAMIVVHKDFLLNQWKERIEEFVPSARIGMLKAKVMDVKDKDIVLASLQSLSMKSYDPAIFSDFGTLIVDECLPYEQRVATENGPIQIGVLYRMWEQKQKMPKVLSYNSATNTMEYKNITYSWKKTNQNLLEICFERSNLKCTTNHKILTLSGYKEARDISIGDLVICNHRFLKSSTMRVHKINKINNSTDNQANPRKMRRGRSDVFDIEVEDNHNFIACCDSGIGPVVHNCHHTSAEVFSQALKKVSFKYTIGLSATLNRKDGLSKVFKWYIGDVVYKSTKRTDTVNVHIHPYFDPSPSYSYAHEIFMAGTSKPNVAKMINNICSFKPRQVYILNILSSLISKEPKRKILLLSDRRNHLLQLHTLLCEKGYDAGVYMGGMKQVDLTACESKQIILATFAIAAEGYDQKGLDCLILASPKGDVVQAVGRILRDKEKERKYIPLIIDIVDEFSIFENQGKKRCKYYKTLNYNVSYPITDSSLSSLHIEHISKDTKTKK